MRTVGIASVLVAIKPECILDALAIQPMYPELFGGSAGCGKSKRADEAARAFMNGIMYGTGAVPRSGKSDRLRVMAKEFGEGSSVIVERSGEAQRRFMRSFPDGLELLTRDDPFGFYRKLDADWRAKVESICCQHPEREFVFVGGDYDGESPDFRDNT